jgi:excisionase family DNA binding protein
MDETYLTVMEIAELLKLSGQTVRNWIDRGELPAVRVGTRRVRVRQRDLDDFLASAEPAQLAGDKFQVILSDQDADRPLAPDDTTPEIWVYTVEAASADKAVRLAVARWRRELDREAIARSVTVTRAPSKD